MISTQTDTSNIRWENHAMTRDELSNSLKDEPIQALKDDRADTVPKQKDRPADNGQTLSEITIEISQPITPENVNPDVFLGESTRHLTNKLGAPTMLRKEGATEVWQYQVTDCIIDFYFYGDEKTRTVKYTHTRSRFLGGMLNYDACMMNLSQLSQSSATTP